ncbi:MAG: type III-B CRISPR module RAMP protein Cmr1 [Candidatus Competibacteraceae bacterium]
MRIIDKTCPSAPDEKDTDPYLDTTSRSYTIKVITPLFGGGVEAGVNDPVTLIRPSSIRGHLRFWWRATRGASCTSISELRQREGEIWGTTENPSLVILEVNVTAQKEPVDCATWTPRKPPKTGYSLRWHHLFKGEDNCLPYLLFPFQGNQRKKDSKEPAKMIESVEFKLIIRFPTPERTGNLRDTFNKERGKMQLPLLDKNHDDLEKDIVAALWAWVNFGGIGARTRRGCGALYCEALAPPSANTIDDWIKDKVQDYGFPLRDWPTFPKKLYLKNVTGDAIGGWREAIRWFKEFRQGEHYGRDPKPGNTPGRSRWPEPESIRKLICRQRNLNRPNGWHGPDTRIPTEYEYFPRAEFGLPIVFEIRDERVPGGHGNKPIKPTLQYNDDIDRMASPLLLRPLCFKDHSATAMVAVLNTALLESAYLKQGEYDLTSNVSVTAAQIRNSCLSTYPDSPLRNRSSCGSALEAFIAFIKEQGFKEYLL